MQPSIALLSISSIYLSLLCIGPVVAWSGPPENPYPNGKLPNPRNRLEVDLGYSGYTGVHNATTGLNHWYGIRFAQSPLGNLRWQLPVPPRTVFNGTYETADTYASMCPQAGDHLTGPVTAWTPSASQSEDCLFLNVWAPEDAHDLPVMVWIHGGGYGAGNGIMDLTWMIETSKTKFVGVTIQYRLGAFGFLAGNDVQQHGTANAGLHDQYLALQWVQRYISLFGGDPNHVTIGGESAGGGSVMLQAMAYGGTRGDELFDGVFASSPYLPQQYNFYDAVPNSYYNEFATLAGCKKGNSKTAFECLSSADTNVLQNASYTVTERAKYGQWAFLPVTDGSFVLERPSEQLSWGAVNGRRGLIGNNANEGVAFVFQNITTEEDFIDFVSYVMPQLSHEQVQQVLAQYALPAHLPTARFATDGVSKDATAVFVSPFAVGQQQRANNLYAEITFVCPAYWLADAYGLKSWQSYKYEFSLVDSCHGDDLISYFGNADLGGIESTMAPAFQNSFLSFFDSFITHGAPNEVRSYTTDVPEDTAKVLATWPTWRFDHRLQMNLNQTGGSLTIGTDRADPYHTIIQTYVEPGLVPDFKVVDGYAWEGGRGERCDFWKSIGASVPEKR